jgi:hypothetical protein
VRDKVERYGLTHTIDPRHFYPTVGAAVTAFRGETGTEWLATDGGGTTGDGQAATLTGGNRDGQERRQK